MVTVPFGGFIWSIPGEPVAQGRPRACVIAGRARMYTPKKSDAWCGMAVQVISSAWEMSPCEGPVTVVVHAIFSRPKRLLGRRDPDCRIAHWSKPDSDNVAKAVLDAMVKAGVLRDDAQVQEFTIGKWYAARDEGPCVQIRLERAKEEHQ